MAEDFAHADDLGDMDAIESPENMANLDILDMCNRIDRGMFEAARSQSATRGDTKKEDVGRWLAIVTHIKTRFAQQASQPELDMPKYHPKRLRMPTPPKLKRVENNDAQQFINLLAALRIETAFSESHERSTAWSTFDKGRIEKILDKITQHLETVKSDPALDTPDVDRQETGANPNQPHKSKT